MSNERDTHFIGSAAKLYEQLARNVVSSEKSLSDVEAFKQEQYQIIAQYAYDLALHVTGHVAATTMDSTLVLRHVPDLTERPVER